MHSFFSERMGINEASDNLTEVIRAASSSSGGAATTELTTADWSFLSMDGIFNGHSSSSFHDPLLHELLEGSELGNNLDPMVSLGEGKFHGEEMRGPCDIFSHVLHMAPESLKAPPLPARTIRPYTMVPSNLLKVSNGSAMEHGAATQISPPQAPGTKRRKGQARKVVCIPAPAATSNKTSGEVVPSDLWAWRKYGQKPIKGSPYPRGYYRCSSSKGCPARKQVERSRNEPNMLVITYTSEHNHQWPTQRNALAGSTRSQPAKNINSSTSNSSPNFQRPPLRLKEEHSETTSSIRAVEDASEAMEVGRDHESDHILNHNYESNHSDDYFTGLGELGTDSLDLHFTEWQKSDVERNNTLDHFSFFEWAGNSFGEAKGGL